MKSANSATRKRFALVGLVVAALSLAALEGLARFGMGLGDPPLVEASPAYGYRFRPDQDIRRFGKRVFYNHYGLRSEPMEPRPPAGVTRVLCVGDSVTNGGALTDQAQTYPYLLQDLLRTSGDPYEVLNASAGSWGIGNVLAYLQAEGLYGSGVVVIELGSHDLWQQKSDSSSVGTRDMPDEKPMLALQEAVLRYLPRFLPKQSAPAAALPAFPPEYLERNLADLSRTIALIRAQNARPLVMLVPEPKELDAVPEQVVEGQRRLAETMAALHVPYRWLLEDFRAARDVTPEPLFRDGIHPNPAGNAAMARAAAQLVAQIEAGGR